MFKIKISFNLYEIKSLSFKKFFHNPYFFFHNYSFQNIKINDKCTKLIVSGDDESALLMNYE